MNRAAPILFLLLLALVAAGVIGVAEAPIAPPQEKVERTLADDHLPH